MKIAVVSDFHLGLGGRSDHFVHDRDHFATFLDRLEDEHDRIVLLGDIVETLSGRMPYRAKARLRAVQTAHSWLFDRVASSPYVFVHGNHDIVAREHGVAGSLLVEYGGVRALFTHGHHNDWVIRNARWLSETGVWVGGWLSRARLDRLRVLISTLEDDFRAGRDVGESRFLDWAMGVAERRGADVIVTGHTHRPAHIVSGETRYLNPGPCSDGYLGYVSLDLAEHRFQVFTGRPQSAPLSDGLSMLPATRL